MRGATGQRLQAGPHGNQMPEAGAEPQGFVCPLVLWPLVLSTSGGQLCLYPQAGPPGSDRLRLCQTFVPSAGPSQPAVACP